MKTDQEKIEVMQAHLRGEKVEIYLNDCKQWLKASLPKWDWSYCDYRIAPREPRKITVAELYDGSLCLVAPKSIVQGAKLIQFIEVLP